MAGDPRFRGPPILDEVRVLIRLPRDLHAALVAMARNESRSVNTQIWALLAHGSGCWTEAPADAERTRVPESGE